MRIAISPEEIKKIALQGLEEVLKRNQGVSFK